MTVRVLDCFVIFKPISLIYVGTRSMLELRVKTLSNSVLMICTVCLWDGTGGGGTKIK